MTRFTAKTLKKLNHSMVVYTDDLEPPVLTLTGIYNGHRRYFDNYLCTCYNTFTSNKSTVPTQLLPPY